MNRPVWLNPWKLSLLVLGAITLSAISLAPREEAYAQKEKATSAEEHLHSSAGLKQAFGTAQVDLFFEMGELESAKPGLAGVKFVDSVDVTGKELLRFERSGETWLIDPDTVFAYKMHKSK